MSAAGRVEMFSYCSRSGMLQICSAESASGKYPDASFSHLSTSPSTGFIISCNTYLNAHKHTQGKGRRDRERERERDVKEKRVTVLN